MVDEQFLLPQLHQRVANGGVAVGVELHGVSHDVGHLVVASVVQPLHGVQDASLHGFQPVVDVGHGALQDDVGGIVQKPVLVHAAQLVSYAFVPRVGGVVVGVFVACYVDVLRFVAHSFVLYGQNTFTRKIKYFAGEILVFPVSLFASDAEKSIRAARFMKSGEPAYCGSRAGIWTDVSGNMDGHERRDGCFFVMNGTSGRGVTAAGCYCRLYSLSLL